MGLLLGPAMCGIYFCLFRKSGGRRVTFEMLFCGFDYFVQSLVATLVVLLPVFALLGVCYAVVFIGFVATMSSAQAKGQQPNLVPLVIATSLFAVVVVVISLVVQTLFIFTYPLIVNRRLSGSEAVKTSARAAFANMGALLGLVLLSMLLGFIGVLACYIGSIFLMPLSFAANAVAYEAVFSINGPSGVTGADDDFDRIADGDDE